MVPTLFNHIRAQFKRYSLALMKILQARLRAHAIRKKVFDGNSKITSLYVLAGQGLKGRAWLMQYHNWSSPIVCHLPFLVVCQTQPLGVGAINQERFPPNNLNL